MLEENFFFKVKCKHCSKRKTEIRYDKNGELVSSKVYNDIGQYRHEYPSDCGNFSYTIGDLEKISQCTRLGCKAKRRSGCKVTNTNKINKDITPNVTKKSPSNTK